MTAKLSVVVHDQKDAADAPRTGGADVENAAPGTGAQSRLNDAQRAAREQARRLVARAIHEHSSESACAKRLGKSRSYVSGRVEPDGKAWSVGDLLLLPPSVLSAVAQQLAAVADERGHRTLPLDTRLHRVVVETGDVHRAALLAMADGVLTQEERAAVAREAREAAAEFEALARDVEAA